MTERFAPHMMDFPLLLSTLYERAARIYPNREIVSVEADGSRHRTNYGETDQRVRQLAGALQTLGLEAGGVVGSFAWNTYRHHELYWATANTGVICHTLNIRLFPDQLRYIINHGGAQVIFLDASLAGVLEPLAAELPNIRHWVIFDGDASETELAGAISYEELLAQAPPYGSWPELDERSPHMLCYTSGTTGNPKGVAYTQRSTYMHTISGMAFRPLGAADNLMPVVPMFHAAGWGYPFMATTAGAKITYPGHDLSAQALVGLIEEEKVTFSAGVPTVWLGVQNFLSAHPHRDTSSIHSFLCGGAAVPRAMIDWFRKNRGIRVVQGWGMTETNPVCAIANLRPDMEGWDWERQLDFMETAGLPIPGLRVKIVDEDGTDLPQDGEAFGELLIQGPWIAAEYYQDERSAETMVDGWLRTGDVCKITPEGYIRITDRSKDMIKSGGEWISTIDLENTIMAHPAVAEATVVGIQHEKWQERPLAIMVLLPGHEVTPQEVNRFLESKVAKWWLPDRYLIVDEIPKTSTGKFDKKVVREKYSDLFDQPDAAGPP